MRRWAMLQEGVLWWLKVRGRREAVVETAQQALMKSRQQRPAHAGAALAADGDVQHEPRSTSGHSKAASISQYRSAYCHSSDQGTQNTLGTAFADSTQYPEPTIKSRRQEGDSKAPQRATSPSWPWPGSRRSSSSHSYAQCLYSHEEATED